MPCKTKISPYQGELHGFQFRGMELPNFQNLAATTTK